MFLVLSIIGLIFSPCIVLLLVGCAFAKNEMRKSIFVATAIAISCSLLALALSVSLSYMFQTNRSFFALPINGFVALLALIFVLQIHRTMYKYDFHKSLIAFAFGIVLLIPTGLLAMFLIACMHGQCK
jgi:hypothetical protein